MANANKQLNAGMLIRPKKSAKDFFRAYQCSGKFVNKVTILITKNGQPISGQDSNPSQRVISYTHKFYGLNLILLKFVKLIQPAFNFKKTAYIYLVSQISAFT